LKGKKCRINLVWLRLNLRVKQKPGQLADMII
jgi:hypothetical protein